MMPHHWRPLAHEQNSLFKCKQHACTLHDPWGPEKNMTTQWCRDTNWQPCVAVYVFWYPKILYLTYAITILSFCSVMLGVGAKDVTFVIICYATRQVPSLTHSSYWIYPLPIEFTRKDGRSAMLFLGFNT